MGPCSKSVRFPIVSSVVALPGVEIPGHVPSRLGYEQHPMRVMTRRVAGLDTGDWDATAISDVTDVFDAPRTGVAHADFQSKH